MRILLRGLAILMGHVAAGLAVASSAWSWPESLLYWLPTGILFSVCGYFYLALEIALGVMVFLLLDLCGSAWSRVLVALATVLAFSWVGRALAPRLGEGRLYPEGYLLAGFVFATVIVGAGVLTRRRSEVIGSRSGRHSPGPGLG